MKTWNQGPLSPLRIFWPPCRGSSGPSAGPRKPRALGSEVEAGHWAERVATPPTLSPWPGSQPCGCPPHLAQEGVMTGLAAQEAWLPSVARLAEPVLPPPLLGPAR